MLKKICMISSVKWLSLFCLVIIIFLQLFGNVSFSKVVKLKGFISNNIFIAKEADMKEKLVQGVFANKIDKLGKTVTAAGISTVKSTSHQVTSTVASDGPGTEKGTGLKLCPLVPPGLNGPIKAEFDLNTWDVLHKNYPDVSAGGRWWPKDCKARHRVAIIIPYRNREDHLKILLNNMHPMLQRQQLDYGFFIVEQEAPAKFNRAMLFNIGYAEAIKKYPYQCFVFHDVDLLPENDKNIYSCPNQPRHMSVAIDKFNYNLPYSSIFGGVSALTNEQMIKVNGFSNKFFGWGGEDDDMSSRVRSHYSISRYPKEIARYRMIKHGVEKGNKANPERFRLLRESNRRFRTDGVSSLKGLYTVNLHDDRKMFTLLRVILDEAAVAKS